MLAVTCIWDHHLVVTQRSRAPFQGILRCRAKKNWYSHSKTYCRKYHRSCMFAQCHCMSCNPRTSSFPPSSNVPSTWHSCSAQFDFRHVLFVHSEPIRLIFVSSDYMTILKSYPTSIFLSIFKSMYSIFCREKRSLSESTTYQVTTSRWRAARTAISSFSEVMCRITLCLSSSDNLKGRYVLLGGKTDSGRRNGETAMWLTDANFFLKSPDVIIHLSTNTKFSKLLTAV